MENKSTSSLAGNRWKLNSTTAKSQVSWSRYTFTNKWASTKSV